MRTNSRWSPPSFTPTAVKKTTQYDVFGNARILTEAVTSQLSRITTQDFDNANRLIKVTHPQRLSGTASYLSSATFDLYGYDQLGNRISHTDAANNTEKTFYDSLGRVVKTTSAEQLSTQYSYTYLATVTGVGGVQVGGYQKQTTRADGKTAADNVDYFGHLTWHRDYGNHTFTYYYNAAGWLTAQGGSSGQNIAYEYFSNGYLKAIDDQATHTRADYLYDAEGNRTFEGYSQLLADGVTRDYYQQSYVTYDELNRVTRIFDPRSDIRYEYDANGNRMHVWSYYQDGIGGNQQFQDLWYRYDSMNRFVVTMGQLSGARGGVGVTVVTGTTSGVQIGYDLASQRVSAIYGSDGHKERYTYTQDGYLEATYMDPNPNDATPEVLRGLRTSDAVGRVVTYQEYSGAGAPTLTRVTTYDKDSNIKDQKEWDGAKPGDSTGWARHTSLQLRRIGRRAAE